MTTFETTVPVPESSIQRTLRSSSSENEQALAEEVALERAEEKLMHQQEDEEIESCDESGKPVVDTDKLERRMMTVALVKSVVETSGGNGGAATNAKQPDDEYAAADKKHTYGLRKRNLKSGQDSSDDDDEDQAPRRRARKTQPLKKRSVPTQQGNGSNSESTQQQVPNPLVGSVNPPQGAPVAATAASVSGPVPCPLPANGNDRRPDAAPSVPIKATETGAAGAAGKRGRIFSIDIDPEGLEFPDMNMDVSMQAAPPSSRARTASIGQGSQADSSKSSSVTFKHQGEHKDSLDVSLPSATGGRGRAMSFEFFSFGINADEPLPPAPIISGNEQVAPAFQRPRGDSIIFEPDSFRDGGVLEEQALGGNAKPRTASIDLAPEELALLNTPGFATVPVANKGGASHPGAPKRSVSNDAGATRSHATTSSNIAKDPNNVATLPSLLNSSDTPSHTTFQMELLNKDGRIGIYLPEARKARIAKFHSKRKMRIWRKRIKYDCRKKLADSRPRIKGRFVKRSDMD